MNATSDPRAEPVLKVDTREELVYLLGQACEIEHGLMCEYLYAQFSLKRGPDEGLTPEQWQTVGHLYRGIEAGLATLCARYGEDAVHTAPIRLTQALLAAAGGDSRQRREAR